MHEDTRLLTMTGPPGCGKTRLALALATAVADRFADGATFVDLGPIRDASLVPSSVMDALAIREVTERSPFEMLVQHLVPRHLLLVLDNFEHLLIAAPLVSEILAACPRLRVLATSRAPLHLRWEREWPVSPLGVPDLALPLSARRIGASPAVSLFVERARSRDQAEPPSLLESLDVLEGATSNVLAVFGRRLVTPPERRILMFNDGVPPSRRAAAAAAWGRIVREPPLIGAVVVEGWGCGRRRLTRDGADGATSKSEAPRLIARTLGRPNSRSIRKEEDMAIVVMFEVDGATSSKYDEVIRRLTEIGQRVPDGQMYHICYGDKERLQVIDVFKSQAKLDAFGAKLMPILKDMSIEAKPTVFEVYNIIEGQ
jgi:hypothetical protein